MGTETERPAVEFLDVTKSYHSGTASEVFPLKDVNFRMHRGERVLLLGKSGSGKSTFLNIIGGVDSPTSGNVFFDGTDLTKMSSFDLAWYRRKEVGFIFQSFNLFSTLTVGENMMLPLDLLKIPDESRAKETLAATGLSDHWKKFPEQLSGGEQQRVAIARALVKDPRLLLADEPTGNLDFETGNAVLELIDNICRNRNTTLIMVTHSTEALWIADRVCQLKLGALFETEDPTGRT